MAINDCPFCLAGESDLEMSEGSGFYIRCTNCGAEGPWSKESEVAVNRWNEAMDMCDERVEALRYEFEQRIDALTGGD